MKSIEITSKTPKLYSLRETAQYLNIDSRKLKELVMGAYIGCYMIQSKPFFTADHISAFLISNEIKAV